MHRPTRLISMLLLLMCSSLAYTAPQWDRYGQPGLQRSIPGAIPDPRYTPPPPPPPQFDPAQDARRQINRMSPEERRNLRKQINEAGQDIYNPRK